MADRHSALRTMDGALRSNFTMPSSNSPESVNDTGPRFQLSRRTGVNETKKRQRPTTLSTPRTRRRSGVPIPSFTNDLKRLEQEFFDESPKQETLKRSLSPILLLESDDDSVDLFLGFQGLKKSSSAKENQSNASNSQSEDVKAPPPPPVDPAPTPPPVEAPPPPKRRQVQPERPVLIDLVDSVFAQSADWASCTVGQVRSKLEAILGLKLSKGSRQVVRERLTELVEQASNALERPKGHMAVAQGQSGSHVQSNTPIAQPVEPQATPKVLAEPTTRIAAEPAIPLERRAPRVARKQADFKPAAVLPPVDTSLALASSTGPAPAPAKRVRQPKSAAAATSPKAPPKKPPKRCQLCSSCPCTFHTGPETISTLNLAKSDAAMERALMKRLQKLETQTERYEEQTDAVRRKLKSHRRAMWRKLEQANGASDDSHQPGISRFLPDVEELDRQVARHAEASAKVPPGQVKIAKAAMFSFAPNFQPTLTQMMGVRTSDGNADKDGDASECPSADDMDAASSDIDEQCPSPTRSLASNVKSPSPVKAQRVTVRNGVESGGSLSIWAACLSGGVQCPWDRLFDDPSEADNLDLEQLHIMLSNVDVSPDKNGDSASQHVQLSMLSQRGAEIATELIDRIASDSEKVKLLEIACPSWRENVLYAMHQREIEDVADAIASVKEARAKLLRAKAAILQAAEQRELALGVFEDSLHQSLARLQQGSNDEGQEGYFLSQAVPSPPRSDRTVRASLLAGRESMDTVDTIISSQANGLLDPRQPCSSNQATSPSGSRSDGN